MSQAIRYRTPNPCWLPWKWTCCE